MRFAGFVHVVAVATLALVFGLVAPAAAQLPKSSDPETYVASLRAKYGARVKFETDYARRVVEEFALDCQAPDGRTLPLMNAMLAKLASLDGKDMYLTTRVDSRGEDVRIYDQLVERGRTLDSRVAFEINKWGELRSPEGKITALRNACFGSYGPIWRMPTTARASSSEPGGEAKKLVDDIATLNSRCRGGSGDSPATQAACTDRDKAMKRLQALGWCWGPEDAVGADKRWVRCGR